MLQPGDRIGRYDLHRRLGRGGMGTVYVAHDRSLGRMVAIKVFAGDLDADDASEKFFQEARAAAALKHDHIVTIHDVGEFDGQPFIVMEHIPGDTIERLIRNKAELPLGERLRLLQELCAGVAYAHGFDVVHRDIKPANLIVERESQRLKILDFGIARMRGSSLSRSTALVGTPGYMAPEQIRGGGVDRRSDLFSVGVVAYELLSYATAFPGDSFEAVTHRILTQEPVSLTELVDEIPSEVVALVERALAKSPADRFPDAESLGQAITQARRLVASDPRWTTSPPTLAGGSFARPRTTGPGSGAGPGSGPGRRDSTASHRATPGSGGVTGRDDLMRRRAAQIEQALAEARRLVQQHDLAGAHELCLNALAMDEHHADAQELERQVLARMAVFRTQTGAPPAPTPAATVAGDPSRSGEPTVAWRPPAPVVPPPPVPLDEPTVVSRPLPASSEPTIAGRPVMPPDPTVATRPLDQGPGLSPGNESSEIPTPTIVMPAGRRTPPSGVSPAATPLRDAGSPAVRAGAGREAAAPAPARPVPKPAPKPVRSGPSPLAAAVAPVQAAVAGVASAVRRAAAGLTSQTLPALADRVRGLVPVGGGSRGSGVSTAGRAVWLLGAAGLAGVVAITYFLWPSSPAGPVPTGTVVVDAQPWATVTAVVGADGSPHLPEPSPTPLPLDLPAGSYTITLKGPKPDSPTRTVAVTIEVGRMATIEDIRFPSMTAEEYFAPYMTSEIDDAGVAAAAPAESAGTLP